MVHFLHMLYVLVPRDNKSIKKKVPRLIKQKGDLFLLYQNKTPCQNASKQVRVLFTTR